MRKNKIIENVDHDLWTDFSAKCRKDGVKVAEKIQDLIRGFLEADENGRKAKDSRG